MNRFLLYSPDSETYIKILDGSWFAGFQASEVNTYDSLEAAQKVITCFDSLKQMIVIEAKVTVKIVKRWELV